MPSYPHSRNPSLSSGSSASPPSPTSSSSSPSTAFPSQVSHPRASKQDYSIKRARTETSPYPSYNPIPLNVRPQTAALEGERLGNMRLGSATMDDSEIRAFVGPGGIPFSSPSHPLPLPPGSISSMNGVPMIYDPYSYPQQQQQQHYLPTPPHHPHQPFLNHHPSHHIPAPTLAELAHAVRSALTTSAQDRARHQFVQTWLTTSYTVWTDGNVSRQGLYGSYLRVCEAWGVKAINSASFGKAVRQAFPTIKTRRLGVRGNSKYHYCGIRPSNPQEAQVLALLSRSDNVGEGTGGVGGSGASQEESGGDVEEEEKETAGMTNNPLPPGVSGRLTLPTTASLMPTVSTGLPQTPRTARPLTQQQHSPSDQQSQSLSLQQQSPAPPTNVNVIRPRRRNGQGEVCVFVKGVERVIPEFPRLESEDEEEIKVWELIVEHEAGLIESVAELRFDQFEMSFRSFWGGLSQREKEVSIRSQIGNVIYKADAVVFNEILEFLHNQTLVPMPVQAFVTLRQLADNMEQIIIQSLNGFPQSFIGPKIELAARFGHLIVRHLGICQLTHALNGLLENPMNVRQMAEGWESVDFENVRNQAALVTNCQHDLLSTCFSDFRLLLQTPNFALSIPDIILFLESTYERCLRPSIDGISPAISPRSLLVRWSYVCSQIMRDLTLKSSPSFGTFQILVLFCEEWLGLKVLRKVALQISAISQTDSSASNPSPMNSTIQQQSGNGDIRRSHPVPPPLNLSSPGDFLNFSHQSPSVQPLFSPTTQSVLDNAAVAAGMGGMGMESFVGFSSPQVSLAPSNMPTMEGANEFLIGRGGGMEDFVGMDFGISSPATSMGLPEHKIQIEHASPAQSIHAQSQAQGQNQMQMKEEEDKR